MKYFICSCVFEPKLGCGIVNIERLIKEGFIDFNYLILVKNDCCYVCCKKTIEFTFECYRSSDIQYTCATCNLGNVLTQDLIVAVVFCYFFCWF